MKVLLPILILMGLLSGCLQSEKPFLVDRASTKLPLLHAGSYTKCTIPDNACNDVEVRQDDKGYWHVHDEEGEFSDDYRLAFRTESGPVVVVQLTGGNDFYTYGLATQTKGAILFFKPECSSETWHEYVQSLVMQGVILKPTNGTTACIFRDYNTLAQALSYYSGLPNEQQLKVATIYSIKSR